VDRRPESRYLPFCMSTLGNMAAATILNLSNFHRRMLGVYFAVLGPCLTYRITGQLGRWLYRLLDPIRERSEAQCEAALSRCSAHADIPRIAEQAFVHRVWGLADLMLAERFLHPNTFHRYGGRIPEPYFTQMLDAQKRGQPTILLTAYYGPFDLLPLFLGYQGIRAGVVYLPHANASFDAYRKRIRERSGCELFPVDQAADRLGQILATGGTTAIVADHHADRRGLPVTFLGLPTRAMRSVGLLAWRYGADVVVSAIRRVHQSFHFEIVVADVIYEKEWANVEDPVAHITERYLRGLEQIILQDPTQYLWAHPRWGEDFVQQLAANAEESAPAQEP